MKSENYRQLLNNERDSLELKPEEFDNTLMHFAELYHTEKQCNIANVVKRTLEQKEAAYLCVNMWYEKDYDSSTPDDEVASMDKEAAELNTQIKVLRNILSEVGDL